VRIVVVTLMILVVRDATAQVTSGSTVIRANVAVGQIYLDEGFPDHTEVGGSFRVFVSPRIAVQGELSHFGSRMAGLPDEFTYTMYLTALRLFGPPDRNVHPYVVGGINLRSGGIGNTARWPYGGVGFQFPLGARVTSDFEVGGPLLRVAASVGLLLR
jgi:hypothetical protein